MLSLAQKADVRRKIDRIWAPYLSSAETKILNFLYTQTIDWGLPSDRLLVSHFVYGIGASMGTGLCDKTVRTTLQSLEIVDAIFRRRTPYGYKIAINLEWEPSLLRIPRQNFEYQTGLKTPKKAREIGKSYLSGSVKVTDLYTKGHTLLGTHLSNSPSAIASDGEQDSQVSCRAAMDLAIARNKQARDAAKSKGNKRALEVLWFDALRETFPEEQHALWTAKQRGQAQLVCRSHGPGKVSDILDWLVRQWRMIMTVKFAWLQDTPALPEIGFVLRFKEKFFEAYNEREQLRKDMALPADRRRIRRLVRSGVDEELAKQSVAEESKLQKEREALAEDRKRVDETLRRLEKRAAAVQEPNALAPRIRTRNTVVRPSGDF